MKTTNFYSRFALLFIAAAFACGVASPQLFAQSPQTYTLGSGTNGQLKIELYAGSNTSQRNEIAGSWQIYRLGAEQFFGWPEDILALKIGDWYFAVPRVSSLYVNGNFARRLRITDVPEETNTEGAIPYVTKKFSGNYQGDAFSVKWTVRYDTSNPDYLTLTAVVDASQIPEGTPVSLAYGFNTNVNGYGCAAAITVPDFGYNGKPNPAYDPQLHIPPSSTFLTPQQVQDLRLIGGKNSTGAGDLAGYFEIGRDFDYVRSALTGSALDVGAHPLGMLRRTSDYNECLFGDYAVDYQGGDPWWNGVGVLYHIEAGSVTTINTGMTFSNDLFGELDYSWTGGAQLDSTLTLAPGGNDLNLYLKYKSHSLNPVDGIAFQVDFPAGITLDGDALPSTATGFNEFHALEVPGSSTYKVYDATIGAHPAEGVMRVPVHVDSYGQYVVDGNSISSVKKTLPLGVPATLTVISTAGFDRADERKVASGDSVTLTVKLPDRVVTNGDLTINIAPVTNPRFEAPTSVIIPDGQNSVSFQVKAKNTAQNGESIILALTDTDHPFVWIDNALKEVKVTVAPYLADDLATVVEYNTVRIDMLANDNLSPSIVGGLGLLSGYIIQQPKAGILTDDDGQLLYRHTGASTLTHSVDSFAYSITVNSTPCTAKVYIYVIQSAIGGFSTCRGANYTIDLKGADVEYYWYDENGLPVPGVPNPSSRLAITHITADRTFLVRPLRTADPYKDLPFPKAPLTVRVVNPDGTMPVARWAGMANNDWNNPENWVEVKTLGGFTIETPVLWTPTACTDVVIPSDAAYYPELKDTANCHNITMEDRALLKNPHVLGYNAASVEFRLKPSERDRFVMWSAPLKDMVSGDYHFTGANGQPVWGDVYMNLFQQANPAGGVAQANMFTATFGELDEPLPLGKAFNLKVASTTVSKSQAWRFPEQCEASYTDNKGHLYNNLIRTNNHRFITDGKPLTNGVFTMDVYGGDVDRGQGHLVQVANPYLAWLDVARFLRGNDTQFASSGYLIWDGDVNSGFTAMKIQGDPYYRERMRYLYTGPESFGSEPGYVAPLQSFFVAKRTGNGSTAPVTSVRMSPDWTTTAPSDDAGYIFHSATAVKTGVLCIKAVQGNRTSYALLQYDANASPDYCDDEDVQSLFFDEIPLTLYSLTDRQEPLSIHANGDFKSQPTALGLRIRNAGEIKLEFSGLETFGHNVYLTDREKNVEIDLRQTPEYTFVATKPTGAAALELNDRFSLRMDYTGAGLGMGNGATAAPAMTVSGGNGRIHIHSTDGSPIQSIQIYNLSGQMIYRGQTASDRLIIPVSRLQTYIVKATIRNTQVIEKVIVK
jgi:hypothetical protein